jgi:hypothetical protein
MVKSAGQRAFELYDRLPDSVKVHTDKAIRISAKATKRIRDKEQIQKQGKAWVKRHAHI